MWQEIGQLVLNASGIILPRIKHEALSTDIATL